MSDDSTYEYMVVDDQGKASNLGHAFGTLEAAENQLRWHYEVRRPAMLWATIGEILEERRAGHLTTNQARMNWTGGDRPGRGERDRTYRIIRRRIHHWEEVPPHHLLEGTRT